MRRLAGTFVIAGLLAFAAPASAETFYVDQAGDGPTATCPMSNPCDLQEAVAAAEADVDTGADTVQIIGPFTATITDANRPTALDEDLHIIGSGRGAGGTLINSDSRPALLVTGAGSSFESMSIQATGNASGPLVTVPAGGLLQAATVDRPPGTGNGSVVGLANTGPEPTTASDVQVVNDSSGGSAGISVGTGGGPATIDDARVTARGPGISAFNGGDVVVRRSLVRGIARSIETVSGELHVSSTILLTHPTTLGAYRGVYARGTLATLRNVTVDAQGTEAVVADNEFTGDRNSDAAEVAVHGSIFRNATLACEPETTPGPEVPTIAVDTSNVDNAAPPECGAQGTGNVDVDPQWIDPANPESGLLGGSPMIDAAGTTAVTDPETNQDFNRAPRLRDGNGNGTAERDMGAVEYQPQAPNVVAAATPGSALPGETFNFSGAGTTDPNPGDTLTYQWAFDDGLLAPAGPSASRTFGSLGAHTGTLTVTDQSGQSAQATAGVTVTAPQEQPPQQQPGGGGGQPTPPQPIGPAFTGRLGGRSSFRLRTALSRGVGPFSLNPARPNWTAQATLLQGRKVVGRATTRGAQPSRTTFNLRLTRAARKSYRRKRSVRLTLRVVVSSAVGDPATMPLKRITLRR